MREDPLDQTNKGKTIKCFIKNQPHRFFINFSQMWINCNKNFSKYALRNKLQEKLKTTCKYLCTIYIFFVNRDVMAYCGQLPGTNAV